MTDQTLTPGHTYTYRGEGTSRHQPWCWNVGRALSRAISVLAFRLHVSGQTHIPASGPALIIANHQSFLDPWLLGIAPSRQLHYMARDTLFKGGTFTWAIETLNAFPVKRGTADRNALKMASERLQKGFIVSIFAEGTRSLDGTIAPILPGMILILRGAKCQVPVIPTVIDGAFDAWPRTAKFPHPHPIRIEYGTPVPSEALLRMPPDQAAAMLRERMVALQEKLGSRHAPASRQRLLEGR